MAIARAKSEGTRLGRFSEALKLERRIREAPGQAWTAGVRKIAEQFGVDASTVQRISRPFAEARAWPRSGTRPGDHVLGRLATLADVIAGIQLYKALRWSRIRAPRAGQIGKEPS